MTESHDKLTEFSIDWVTDTVDLWIEANEMAQQIQRSMPLYTHERLLLLPEGHDALPMAMALSMRPETISEAHEWLVSARAQVQVVARLSHPWGTLDQQGSRYETTGRAVERSEDEMDRLEQRMDRIESMLERLIDLRQRDEPPAPRSD